MGRRLDAKVVSEAAEKRGWLSIHQSLLPGLDSKIFDRAPGKRHVTCPVHGTSNRNGKGNGFRFFRDADTTGGGICNTCGPFHNGFRLIMAVNNSTFPEALELVAAHLGIEGDGEQPRYERRESAHKPAPRRESPKPAPKRRGPSDDFIRGLLRKAWEGSVPLDHPSAMPVVRYFARRRLSIEPLIGLPNFRFHPALDYFDDDGVLVGQFPALLAGMCDVKGRPINIHRYYLTVDGQKAPVEDPRKMYPFMTDRPPYLDVSNPRLPEQTMEAAGYIKIGDASRVLGVAEGLETALAVHLATGMTVWCLVCADFLERFVPPPEVEQLVIWGDHDRPAKGKTVGRGREAAQRLQARAWELGLRAQVMLPAGTIPDDKKGVDWNDVWCSYGQAGFPKVGASVRELPIAVGAEDRIYAVDDYADVGNPMDPVSSNAVERHVQDSVFANAGKLHDDGVLRAVRPGEEAPMKPKRTGLLGLLFGGRRQ